MLTVWRRFRQWPYERVCVCEIKTERQMNERKMIFNPASAMLMLIGSMHPKDNHGLLQLGSNFHSFAHRFYWVLIKAIAEIWEHWSISTMTSGEKLECSHNQTSCRI